MTDQLPPLIRPLSHEMTADQQPPPLDEAALAAPGRQEGNDARTL